MREKTKANPKKTLVYAHTYLLMPANIIYMLYTKVVCRHVTVLEYDTGKLSSSIADRIETCMISCTHCRIGEFPIYLK